MAKNTENETTQETAQVQTAPDAAQVQNPAEEKVDIFIPKGAANDDPNLFVSVNGVNYLLPRGQTSRVPKHIADEIKRSWKAEDLQDRRIDELKDNKKSE